jgi:hypothetical protein
VFIFIYANVSSNPSFYFCCCSSGGGCLFGSTGTTLTKFHKIVLHTQTSLTLISTHLFNIHIPLFSTCHHGFVWVNSCPSYRRIVRINYFCPSYFRRTVWFHSGSSDWWFVRCTGPRYVRGDYCAILYFNSYFLPQYFLFARHL